MISKGTSNRDLLTDTFQFTGDSTAWTISFYFNDCTACVVVCESISDMRCYQVFYACVVGSLPFFRPLKQMVKSHQGYLYQHFFGAA